LRYSKFDLSIFDDLHTKSAVGHLGTNAFSDVDVEIDLQQKKLNIFSQDHCPGGVVYWAKDFDVIPLDRDPTGKLYLEVELDGRLMRTGFNTATPTSYISEAVTKKLFGFDSESEGVEKVPDATGRAISHYRSMGIASHGLQITNAKINILKIASGCRIVAQKDKAARFADCYGTQPFSMGTDVLSKLRIYLATKEKKMYFTVNGTTPQ
jgi:hypothetical protein